MITFGIIFLLIATGINVSNFTRIAREKDHNMTLVMNMMIDSPNPPQINIEEQRAEEESHRDMFFFATKNEDGTYSIELDHIFDMDENEAKYYVEKAFNSKKDKGYIGEYRFVKNNDKNSVIIVDCTKDFTFAKNTLWVSIGILLGGLGAIFGVVYLTTSKILKPVRESYDRQSIFISNASHELKTPLTIISANNEITEVEKGETNQTITIANQVNKMNTVIKNLTLLTNVNEMTKVNVEEINISDLADEIITSFKSTINNEKVAFNISVDNDIIFKTNRNLISQILFIILENANKYGENYINLSIFINKNNKLCIYEENESHHIDEGSLNHYADRFYRSSEVRNTVSGSGIGLSILKDIVNLLKGELSINGKNNVYSLKIEFKQPK